MSYEPFRSLQTVIKSVTNNAPLSRRDLLIGNAEGIVGLSLLLYTFGSCATQELTFVDAQRTSTSRQRYVNQTIKSNPPPAKIESAIYRHDIKYFPNTLFPYGGMVMRTGFTIPARGSGAQSAKIEVYRSAFEDLVSEDEFLNFLVDHEYMHVRWATQRTEITAPLEVHKELFTRVLPIQGDLFEAFQELEAFFNQIKAFPKRSKIRPSLKNDILGAYRTYRLLVEEQERTPLTHWILERYPQSP